MTQASLNSITIGDGGTAATGNYAVAIGTHAVASGMHAIAIGENARAYEDRAIVFGTHDHKGPIIIGGIDIRELFKNVEQLKSDMAALHPQVEYARDQAARVIQRYWLEYRYAPGRGTEYKQVAATTTYKQKKDTE